MEVQYMNVGPRKAFIIYIICKQCYERLEPTKEYSCGVPTDHNKTPKLIHFFPHNGIITLPASEIIHACPKCNHPITFVEYVIKKKPGKWEGYLCKITDRSLPLSIKATAMALEVIKGKTLKDVGDMYDVTGPWVSYQTLRVFKRLLPSTWKKLEEETKASQPTVIQMRKHKTAFTRKLSLYWVKN